MNHYAAGLDDTYDDDEYGDEYEDEEMYDDEDYEDESIYDYDPEKQKTFAAFWTTLLIILVNAVAIGVVVEFTFLTKSRAAMVTFSEIFGTAGVPLNENLASSLQAVFVLAGASLVISLVAFWYFGSQRAKEAKEGFVADPRKDTIAKSYACTVIFLACLSVMFTVFCFLFLGLLSNTVTDPVDLVVKDDTQQKMFDYELAIFNECCAGVNFTEQGEIQLCVQDLGIDCSNLPSGLDAFESNLCACYDSAPRHDAFKARIGESTLCSDLNQVPVTITQETQIPGIPVSITFIITSLYPTAVLPSSADIPVVGFPRFDPNGGDQFGCGIGYAKGFMFILSVWAEQSIGLSLYILIGTQLLLIILAVTILSCVRISTDDWTDDVFMQEPLLSETTPQVGSGKLQTAAIQNAMFEDKGNVEKEESGVEKEEEQGLLREDSEKREAIYVGGKSKGPTDSVSSQGKALKDRRRRRKRTRRPVTGQFVRPHEPVFDDYVAPQEQIGGMSEEEEPRQPLVGRTKPERARRREKKLVQGEFVKGRRS